MRRRGRYLSSTGAGAERHQGQRDLKQEEVKSKLQAQQLEQDKARIARKQAFADANRVRVRQAE